jgi:hypothetical protein
MYDRVAHLEIAHDVWLKLCNTYEGFSEIKSSVDILITESIRLFLRNLVNRLIIDLLALTPLSVAYVLVILLLILIMNVLNNSSMRLMILYGA